MPITEIGKRLKKAIQAKSLMQIQVVEMAAPLLEARGMKLSPSKLSQYITGKSTPDSDMIELLAEVLEVNPAWLAGFEKEKPTLPEEDELDEELVRMLMKLSAEETAKVLAFVQGLLAGRKD